MATQQLTYENIVCRLLEEVPDVRGVYDDHLKDYDELLPHVFFGDLTRYVIGRFRIPSSALDSNVTRILDVLERAMTASDSKLRELVSVSFLENLDQAGESYESVKKSLGPSLRRELLTYERGR